MDLIERLGRDGHEAVEFVFDAASGYRGIIAIHSTRRGPALGGTRLWHYDNNDQAINDALRLAEGMTYKSAAAGMPWGGGKSVIIADAKRIDRKKIFEAHGRAVEKLRGQYITSVDIGTGPDDMVFVREETSHVAGLPAPFGSPSPATARGVQRAIEAALLEVCGTAEAKGRTVAIQGVGNVGYGLARGLHDVGAKLVVSDVDANRAKRVADEFGARVVSVDQIHAEKVDVFAPCAFGAGLNERTIPELRCGIIAGAANNQLATPDDAKRLADRHIAYAPDFIANAGGLIYLGQEVLGWTAEQTMAKVDSIFDTVRQVFQRAKTHNVTTAEAAVALAKERLK
jgi:leucine dehydrogenase